MSDTASGWTSRSGLRFILLFGVVSLFVATTIELFAKELRPRCKAKLKRRGV